MAKGSGLARQRAGPATIRNRFGSIRARLTAGSAILLAAIVTSFLLHEPAVVRRAGEQALERRARATVDMAAAALAPAFGPTGQDAVGRIVRSLAAQLDLSYVVVLDHGDRVRGAHNPLAAESARFRDAPDGHDAGAGVWRVSAPIGDGAGRVYLGFSLDGVSAQAAEARRTALLLSVLVLVLGTAGVYVVASVLTGRLRAIVRTVDRVAAGDLTARTELRSRDEIGWLGGSFDTMVARLEEAYGALQSANWSLELRVAERTRALQREIDERIRAEGALRESELRFRTMFESAAVGIALLGPDGRFLETNASLSALLGFARADLHGTPLSTLVAPEDRQTWAAVEERLPDSTTAIQEELRFRTADGGTMYARIVASTVSQADVTPALGIVMIDDVTERKALEEQLRQSQKLEAVGRLAGGIAHDFNNLLTTINGLANVLIADHADQPSLRADLDEIRKAGERAAALTGQLLAFSRRQIVMPEVIDLNATIRDMAPMLMRLLGPDIQLRLVLDDELLALRADPSQTAQVMMNLVVNARDAMPEGGHVTIVTENISTADRPRLRITVTDTGTGMDVSTRQRIFEPFFTTKEQGKGTGLGLSTVYGIVQQAGGFIDVDTKPGHGASFAITLPCLDHRPREAQPVPEAIRATGHGTVLVVEDEDPVRELVGRILRQSGYTVIEGRNGVEAFDLFIKHRGRIDAVITDVVMPRMNGPELVRRLYREDPDVAVLFMSGYTPDEVLKNELDHCSTGFIQKPMSPQALTRKLREVLEARRAA